MPQNNIRKHSPDYALYKYINKKILSTTDMKTDRAVYINVCMTVATHAFYYPRSRILLCLVVIM